MKIVDFSGSLNTKVAPSLIQSNQSTININVDPSSFILRPTRLHDKIPGLSFGADGSFTYFKGAWYSTNTASKFVLFNNWLYYYKNGILKKTDGFTTLNAGINTPIANIITTDNTAINITLANATGTDPVDLATEKKLYKITCINTENEYIDINKDFNYTGSFGISINITAPSNTMTIIVQRYYRGTYYIVDTKVANTLTYIDTIEDISGNDLYGLTYLDAADVRQYCYTYYRSIDGAESAPSDLSNEITTLSNNITITGIIPSLDPTVTNIKIYRVGGDLDVFNLVATIANGLTTYTDTLTDSDVVDNAEALLTAGTIPPISNLSGLTLHNSSLFGFENNKVYFSNIAMLDSWGPFNYFTMEDVVTGLGTTQNGLLIFLRNKTYILVGNNTSNYTLYLLSNSQGCIASVTIQYAQNTLVWLSLDGICASTGGDIQVISEPYLGKLNIEPRCSAFYDNKYFLGCDDALYIVDFSTSIAFRKSDIICNGLYYNTDLDDLYFINNADLNVYTYGTSNDANILTYKTGWLTEGSLTTIKTYKTIYIYCVGTIEFTIYIDGALIKTYSLIDGFNEILLPVETLQGYYIEFKFTGNGEIHEIEYKVEDRQNGR